MFGSYLHGSKFHRLTVIVAASSAFIRKFRQIVGFELDTVQFVITAQLLYFLLALLTRQRVFSVFVRGEFAEQVFFSIFLSPLFLRAKLLWYREERHDGIVVDAIYLYLV